MKASSYSKAIQIAIHAHVPLMVTSEPGVGKTQIGHKTIRSVGRTLIHKSLVQTSELDMGGLPYITTEHTTNMAPPAWLTTPNAVAFFDEFTKAPALVMNTAAEMLCEHTVQGVPLPPDMRFILTGNRKRDRAGENDMPTHLRNRMIHISYDTDVDEWVAAAYNNFSDPLPTPISPLPAPTTTDPILIAFIRRFPQHLHAFSTTEDAYPTPRSHGFVNRILPYLREHPELQLEMISGCIGSGAALELVGFMRLIDSMFDTDLCFTNPDQAPVPENPSIMYATITSCASKATRKSANSLFKYIARIPADFGATLVHDMLRRDALITQCPEGIKWMAKNHKMLMGTGT